MPSCKLCGHGAASHSWQRLSYRQCWKCECPGYVPIGALPSWEDDRVPPINNRYISRLRRRR